MKIYLRPRARLKRCIIDLDLSTLAIKGRQSVGNLVTRYSINKIVLKEKGASTLGGQNIWFDDDVRRLNADGRGRLLGEFKGEDKIVVWTSKNQYYITGFDLQQHFPDDTIRVERYRSDRVYAVCYYDGEQKYYYMKRFQLEATDKVQFFLDEGSAMRFVAITDRLGAKLAIEFGGQHAQRPMELIAVDDFIGIKSHRAKGKRLTTYDVATLTFIEPEEPEEEPMVEDEEFVEDDAAMDAALDGDMEAMDDDMDVAASEDVDDEPIAEQTTEEVIDMEELISGDIEVDPTVDYKKKSELDNSGFSAAQLDLF